MKNNKVCYICDNPATSREHVPPQCFFLGDNDSLSGKDFRKNLITVPSCEIHNTGKSKDDEYLLFIICTEFENNKEAKQTLDKSLRYGFYERPHLLREFNRGAKVSTIDGHPSLAIPVDRERFNRSIDHIAQAIYFHHFSCKWGEKLFVICPPLKLDPHNVSVFESLDYNGFLFQVRNWALNDTKDLPKYGHNPEIFYYKVFENALMEIRVLILVFFEGFVSVVFPENQLIFFSQFYLSPLENTKKRRSFP